MNAPQMMIATPDLLAAALEYAARGLPVFPCNPDNKSPLTGNGFHDASTDSATVTAWWRRWPNAMIGLPTGQASGVWVLDIDDPAAFEASAPNLPTTRKSITGKGYHLFWKLDEVEVRNAQRHPKRGWPFAEMPGAEVRGEGGYVILPPSRHPSGRLYRWEGSGVAQTAPADLLRIVTRKRASNDEAPPEAPTAPQRRLTGADTVYGLAALASECSAITGAGNGEQESALNEAALKIGALVAGKELSETTGKSRLIAAGLAMPSFDPGNEWTADAITAKIERGLTAGMAKPRSAPPREWPAPDLAILNASRRAAPAMPKALFGPALDVLEAVASGTSTALDYPACAYLAACASLIGGKRKARPYETSNWTEPAILWIGLVGDPSSRKSPALDEITRPLGALERDGAEAHKAALRGWREADQKAKAIKTDWERSLADAIKNGKTLPAMPRAADAPDEPHRRRTLVMDSTPEAMAAILSGNPQGTLHLRDELAGWLMGFERYAPGGREFWLEAYGGRQFSVDRKGAKDPLILPFNGVSVVGGIQPAKLADCLLNGTDDGLVARFLWSWPDKLPFARPSRVAEIGQLEAAYRRLEGLQWGHDAEGQPIAITLPLAPDAADLFELWQADNAEVDGNASGLLKSFYGKLDGALLRVALTAELAAWAWHNGSEPREISLATVEAAAEWIDDFAKPMAARVYGDASLPTVERNAAALAQHIVNSGHHTINRREIRRNAGKANLSWARDTKALEAALELLALADIIRPAPSRDGDTPGRGTADYAVNPQVHGGAQ